MKKAAQTKWTHFMDMHSGGGAKEKYEHILIEAPEEEARVIFYNRFGHSPDRVTCTCCGEDYSVSESASLEHATGYDRNCEWDKAKGKYVEEQKKSSMEIRRAYNTPDSNKWGLYMTLKEYLASGAALVIYDKDIKPEERRGEVPTEGYVWI